VGKLSNLVKEAKDEIESTQAQTAVWGRNQSIYDKTDSQIAVTSKICWKVNKQKQNGAV
jgi:hypothetical protein